MYTGCKVGCMMHLSDYMAAHQLSDETVAQQIGRTRATVSRIRRRKVRPDWDTLEILKQWSDGEITADAFQDLSAGAAA